ncbi:MAG: tRNA(m5U54)methyltransferase [Caeruleum heppii]|nr:MAG: tRNA(m5U54)methyltransferase [Caeruleum heppii]
MAPPIPPPIPRKRPFNPTKPNKKRKLHHKAVKEGSTEEVLLLDVNHLLASKRTSTNEPDEPPANPETPPEQWSEIELTVDSISSTGDGLALSSDQKHIYIVPFTTSGDTVLAKVVRHFPQHHYTLTDFIRVVKPSSDRDDPLVKCPYFTTCSGCQLQMLPYELQLKHKKTIVEKAYANFSGLSAEQIPAVGETFGSPLQYGYRTKLTPHFDGPPGSRSRQREGPRPVWETVPPIGFMKKNTRKTIDIEDCPIATDAVREGMKRERKRVAEHIKDYKKGATILLREDTAVVKRDGQVQKEDGKGDFQLTKTYVTDQNATTTEFVPPFTLQNPAGAFFQNNNSILPLFTDYIRSVILPPSPTSSQAASSESTDEHYLIDAYSGSGLFTITLHALFTQSIGIDIAPSSIAFATSNARLNHIPPEKARFIAADAQKLFAEVTYPPEKTVVILDPPRKGCDVAFLRQLAGFGANRVVYVSCNVHSMARDVGMLVNGIDNRVTNGIQSGEAVPRTPKISPARYKIDSLCGFDFFPQTGHVEGVAVLIKVEEAEDHRHGAGE